MAAGFAGKLKLGAVVLVGLAAPNGSMEAAAGAGEALGG